ncbi:MAG: hypothetical protein OXH65_01740 [Paracoccaceae bacterium]|nr:hypothetical protein [Paracoccaceae bacterium]MDE2737987.1 hypothetical protein [Paracoccaceae bacterium]MXZ50760.1 hypothetical protein [Paracoccaceae bacterium]MYF45132.1 hypothetical protein [Paracoccaceae bacterium]MYI91516.1 hypothetical protein [Paracoccaceae bacterium]
MAKATVGSTPKLNLLDDVGMILFRGDLKSKTLQDAIVEVTGVKVPVRGKISTEDQTSIAWMSPDELLLFVPLERVGELIEDLNHKMGEEDTLIWDISDLRSVFEIEGNFIREVLAKNTPIDLNKDKMRKGTFRRTRFGQIAVAFWFESETKWFMICRRSEAEYAQQLFEVSSKPGEIPSVF